jgi:hypothetical protein
MRRSIRATAHSPHPSPVRVALPMSSIYLNGLERLRAASLSVHLHPTFAELQLGLGCTGDVSRAVWWVKVATRGGRPS